MPASAKESNRTRPPDHRGRRAAKRSTDAKSRKQNKQPNEKLGREVAEELLKLRPVLKEIGTHLLDRLEGDLTGLAVSLNGGGVAGHTPRLPRPSVLSEMRAAIQALKVKPKKGRVKDLRRVEALLLSLTARIPPESADDGKG